MQVRTIWMETMTQGTSHQQARLPSSNNIELRGVEQNFLIYFLLFVDRFYKDIKSKNHRDFQLL